MKIVDMHCDTLERMYASRREPAPVGLEQNSCHLDLKRMKKAGYFLQNFAVWVDCGKYQEPYRVYRDMVALYERQMARNRLRILKVASRQDLSVVEKSGRLGGMLTVEDAGILEGALHRLEELFADGVRMATLTWNYNNDMAGAAAMQATESRGLTMKGRQCIEEMERLGIILDVSHLSDAGLRDVLGTAKKPFVASHSNARALCGMPRNLPDELLRAMGQRGCVIGLNYFVPFLMEPMPWMGRRMQRQHLSGCFTKGQILDRMVQHIVYLMDRAGEESVGLGSDFDGIETNPAMPGAESVPLLLEALERAGLRHRQIEKICGENVLRLYRELLPETTRTVLREA